MFFVHSISGPGRPYVSGAIARNRAVDRVSEVQAVSSVAKGNALRAATTPVDARKQKYQEASKREERAVVLLYARDIMTSPVVTILASHSIYEASRIMKDRRYRHLPVVSESRILVGILSDRDVLKYLAEIGMDPLKDMNAPVLNIMAKEVIAAAPDAEIRDIAKVMFEDHIGSLPIVSPNGEVEGIVTRSDILRALLKHAPLELWG